LVFTASRFSVEI